MEYDTFLPRYNRVIRKMLARMRRRWRLESGNSLRLISFLATWSLPSLLFRALSTALFTALFAAVLSANAFASNLGDTARQLADRVAAVTGPGSIALNVSNRSSLDEKSVREVRVALEGELRGQGVRVVNAEQAMGAVNVVLSESLREFVWTAEIVIGTDAPRVVLASLPRSAAGSGFAAALPITLKKTWLFSQAERILDAAVVDSGGPGGAGASGGLPASARLLVLDGTRVAAYRQQGGRWELEASLPITVARAFPRDLRGRLLLGRDHLFDVYLPGTFCRSNAAMPLALRCVASDDPWPLTSWPLTSGPLTSGRVTSGSVASGANTTGAAAIAADGSGVRAFFASSRNFFTGALSPGIGKIFNVPAFYSAAVLPRQGYTLWAVAAVDGSAHVIDGVTDQAIRGARWGSDVAAVRSGCGSGTQLLISGEGEAPQDREVSRDHLRAFEIADREPVAVSPALEFEGAITALWTDAGGTSALVVVKREDTGWYEASRITISCAN
jgi:hypothetical protein